MNCKVLGKGGFNLVYEKGGKNVYKVPIKDDIFYHVTDIIGKEIYNFLKKRDLSIVLVKTKFVDIIDSTIGKIKMVQRKIDGELLNNENVKDISKEDFEGIIKLYFDIREKYNFDIDFAGPAGIEAANNFSSPVFDNIIVKDGKMHLIDFGGMTLNGARYNLYNLLEFAKVIGIDDDLKTKLEYEYLKAVEKNSMKSKGLMLYDFIKIKFKNKVQAIF